QVHGGIVWAYLGPRELEPPFPSIDIFTYPSKHLMTMKIVNRGNYLDHMEGDMDASHASILHARLDGASPAGTFSFETQFQDTRPRYFIDETDYGLRLAAQRNS